MSSERPAPRCASSSSSTARQRLRWPRSCQGTGYERAKRASLGAGSERRARRPADAAVRTRPGRAPDGPRTRPDQSQTGAGRRRTPPDAGAGRESGRGRTPTPDFRTQSSEPAPPARRSGPGSDATAYLTCYLRLTFGQNDLPDGLLSDSATYPAAYPGGPRPRGARGAASRSARAAGQSAASAPWMSGAGAIAGAAPPLLQLAWRRQAVIKTISSPRVLASAQSSVRFGEPNGLPRPGPDDLPYDLQSAPTT